MTDSARWTYELSRLDVTQCARRAQGSLLDSLFVWWTAGGGRSVVLSCSLVNLVCWTLGGLSSLRAVKRRRSSWEFHVATGVTWNSPERVDLPSCWNLLLNEFEKWWRVSMSMTMEQVVTQLQQELFTLRAQVAVASGLADAVRAINNLPTAQVRKDTPSLIDVTGLGRPKEHTGSVEDFQLVEEDGGILRWFDQRVWDNVGVGSWTDYGNHDGSDRSRFFADGLYRGQSSAEPGICVAAGAHSTHGSFELGGGWRCRQNSRKNPLEAWRRLLKRCDPTTGARKRNLLRTIIPPGRCSLLELQAGIERWESYMSRYEKKMKDKLDDEIKLAGLWVVGARGTWETSVPQLESHRWKMIPQPQPSIFRQFFCF